jgi:hypothetical protein
MNCEKKTYLAVFLSARNSDKSAQVLLQDRFLYVNFFGQDGKFYINK